MEPCCYADEYGQEFGRKNAERGAKALRRKGLVGTARQMADALVERGVEGASILEVGGGVGGLHLHLLQQGADRAVNVELSPEYEKSAAALLTEVDLADRVGRRVGDFVAGDDLEPADVVVLHRVVCCYPYWPEMLTRAASHSTRLLGMTFPRDRLGTRTVMDLMAGVQRLRGRQFRPFVHPVNDMFEQLARDGLDPVFDTSGIVWRTVVWERRAAA